MVSETLNVALDIFSAASLYVRNLSGKEEHVRSEHDDKNEIKIE